MKPYIIQSFDYAHNSGGIRVLHLLCHHLREAGQEAYVYASKTCSDLNTPTITPYDLGYKIVNEDAIVIYPEVTNGNPFDAKNIVRYLLNKPKALNNAEFTPHEFMVSFSRIIDPMCLQLHIPLIELDIFNGKGATHHKGACYYVGKGKHEPMVELVGATEITREYPKTRRELAQLFKDCSVFYCFDNLTALTTESVLCGTPCVLIPDGSYTKEEYKQSERGLDGLAWGNSEREIQRAKRTMGKVRRKYKALQNDLNKQLQDFISYTQEYFS